MSCLKNISTALLFIFLCSCQQEENNKVKKEAPGLTENFESKNKITEYYNYNKGNNKPSKSLGTVSNGSLINGKLMPYQGKNFQYFDTISYLSGRAFVNDKVRKCVLNTYGQLDLKLPGRKFRLMECSNKEGGKLFPHRTHQNGLSIDFMMPLMKDGSAWYELDKLGATHYWLEFDNNGKYSKDKKVSIDFELIALHILILEKEARKQGLKISKVIIKTELKDELYSGTNGKKLKESGIYVTKNLSSFINSLHDDHYHIDFETLAKR